MASAAQHHFLPRCYLEGFTDPADGKLWAIGPPDRRVIRLLPKNAARERNMYRATFKEGHSGDPDIAEKALSHLEGEFSDIVRRIEKGEFPRIEKDRVDLATFIAFMETRIPEWQRLRGEHFLRFMKEKMREQASDPEKWDAMMTKICEMKGLDLSPEEREEHRLQTLDIDKNFNATVRKGSFPVKEMFDIAEYLWPIIYRMNWHIVKTATPSFCTSSRPVARKFPGIHDWDAGYEQQGVEVTFPLTSRHVLIMTWNDGPEDFFEVPKEVIGGINERTIMCAPWAYAPAENLLPEASNYKDYKTPEPAG